MEVAVRDFVADVSRFLDSSLSGGGGGTSSWEVRCRWQLQQLRRQLQQLLQRYPSLRPAGEEPDDALYDDTAEDGPAEYDDAGGASETVQEALYDDTEDVTADDTYEEPAEQRLQPEEPQEVYDELGTFTGEASYDDTAPLTEPYLPMAGKAARTLGIGIHQPGDKPTPSGSLGSLSGLTVDPEVASLQSQTSQESVPAEQVAAVQLSSAGRRWGRLQLRQDSKLWSPLYRPYWAGLADGRLYLYRRETDPAQKRAIDLSGYEVRRPPPGADVSAKRRPSCFELVKPGGHTHQLLALTPKDARQWMAALEAEGVLVGRSEGEPAEEPPPRPRPPAPPPGPDSALAATAATAAAAAAATSVPLKGPSEPPSEPVEEDLYYVPDEEEQIYEDISWSADGRQRPPSFLQAHRASIDDEGEIYDTVGSPPDAPAEPGWPAPPLPPLAGWPAGRTGALPAVPGQPSPGSPQSPVPPPLPDRAPLAPPSQPLSQPPSQPPPPPPQRSPGVRPDADTATTSAGQPPPPPQRSPAAPAQPPPPPQRSPAAPAQPPPPPQRSPASPVQPAAARQQRVPSPEVIEEELYDELGDIGGQPALPPPSDPFYNVLEPEYLQPRHPSPVPIKSAADEPPDEGYGNSSGGSETDCHPPAKESHYKTLPRQLRPVRPAGSTGSTATPATPTTENDGTPAPAPSTTSTDLPRRPTQLPIAARPRAGTAGAVNSGPAGSVADVVRRLNRQSAGDEEPPAASRPAPRQQTTPVSAQLARKQALIASGVRDLSPAGKPLKPATVPPKPGSVTGKPTAIPPKPAVPAGKPKSKPVLPTRQEAKPAGYGSAGAAGSRPATAPLPNKSAVYKALQRMSNSESRAAGQRTGASPALTAEPEEEEVYAEID